MLQYLLHTPETARRHIKPSCDGTFGCAFLEELNYLCNQTGLNILPYSTCSAMDPNKTGDKSVRKEDERANVDDHHLQNLVDFWGLTCCCLSSEPVITFIYTKAA